jgi:hypothetical protein
MVVKTLKFRSSEDAINEVFLDLAPSKHYVKSGKELSHKQIEWQPNIPLHSTPSLQQHPFSKNSIPKQN